MTWREMGSDNRRVAQRLLEGGAFRSCVSRSYCAAYSIVTSRLAGKCTFSHQGNKPSHAELPNLILHNLPFLDEPSRRQLRRSVDRLLRARIAADYVPSIAEYVPYTQIDRRVAVNALRDANIVLVLLEVPE